MKKELYSSRLSLIRTGLGMGQTEFAQKMDIPRTSLINYEKGISSPSIDFVYLLKEKINVNVDWLLTGEGEMFVSTDLQSTQPATQKIPILRQRVSCGPGQSWEENANVEEFVDITDLMPRPFSGKLYGFRVSGSSMVGAGIRGGDIVLFNPAPDQNMGEGIYVFALDGDVYCKLVKFEKLARRIHFYSMHCYDIEKAELLRTVDTTDSAQVEHLHIFGRVLAWVHPASKELG